MTDKEICKQCRGLPCRKAQHHGLKEKIQREYGRAYLTYEECEYVKGADFIKRSRESGIPGRYANKKVSDYQETPANRDALAISRWYVAEKPARWLYLTGGCGTGKTFLASLIGKEYLRGWQEVIFTDFPSLLEELKDSFDDKAVTASEILRKYQTCDLLILDDVGTGYFRDWGVSVLHQLIDARYNEERRTIITSNYDLGGLMERLSKQEYYAARRIISRLQEMSEVVYMGEDDWRNGAE